MERACLSRDFSDNHSAELTCQELVMIVGVPREVKKDEYRVAMLPVGVDELVRRGHRVLIERGAGQGSGIPDEQYAINGAEIVPDADTVFRQSH